MNLAVQGIDADIRWNNEGIFHRDEFPDLKADFILANPPFNISDWGGERLNAARSGGGESLAHFGPATELSAFMRLDLPAAWRTLDATQTSPFQLFSTSM